MFHHPIFLTTICLFVLLAIACGGAVVLPPQSSQVATSGCCFTIGFGSMMVPCCLEVKQKSKTECLQDVSATVPVVGGAVGWRSQCPASAAAAHMWIKEDNSGNYSQPHMVAQNRACCKAFTAECLACVANISTEEYCAQPGHADVLGCEQKQEQDLKVCCLALTADCLACAQHTTAERYCAHPDHADVPGCEDFVQVQKTDGKASNKSIEHTNSTNSSALSHPSFAEGPKTTIGPAAIISTSTNNSNRSQGGAVNQSTTAQLSSVTVTPSTAPPTAPPTGGTTNNSANTSDRSNGGSKEPTKDGNHSIANGRAVSCQSLPEDVRVHKIIKTGTGLHLRQNSAVSFGIGATVEVNCAPGYVGANATWTITCSSTGTWDFSERECTQLHCRGEGPTDRWGKWQKSTTDNHSLLLKCNEGFIATGGTTTLYCLETGSWELPRATCSLDKANKKEWAKRMQTSELIGLAGAMVILVAVLAACCGDPFRRYPRRSGERDRLMERGDEVAIEEME